MTRRRAGEARIREAGLADIAAMIDIDRRCFAPGVAYDAETFLFYLMDPDAIKLVAEVGGRVAGFIILDARPGKTGNLVTIDVAPESQGGGIGARLMDEMEKIAGGLGLRSVVLQVAASNERAIRFYERRGYRKTRDLENYYQDGSGAWEMIREL